MQSERLIHATASHGYLLTVDIAPEHEMEKVLYAVDELTGLIGAVALMSLVEKYARLGAQIRKEKIQGAQLCRGLLP